MAARRDTDQSTALARVLNPRTIAIVGVSDTSHFAEYVQPTLESDAEVNFVHPKASSVFDRPAYSSLSEIPGPIDSVMIATSARATVAIAEEAARLDVGGLVSIAGGFAEVGSEGRILQQRLLDVARANGMAVVGPNGLGFVNVPRKISLTIASQHKRRPGGISVVSHSGAMLSGVAMAAWEHRGIGLNVIVSAGNEAVTDLADYVNYFVDDPGTRAIGLVVEQIRRPEEFFAAVRRAQQANKPIVVLKLARTPRSRTMAASHTASIASDAWAYDIAFRQHGIGLAYDPEELVDRLQFFDQLPVDRWVPVKGLATISMTGGFASLSMDVATQEGLEVPELERLGPWVKANVPGGLVANPLDATGMGAALWEDITAMYSTADEVDSLLFVHPLADEDGGEHAKSMLGQYAKVAADVDKAVIVSNCSGTPGEWVDPVLGEVALGRGVRPTMRGLASMGEFVRHRQRAASTSERVPVVARPTSPLVEVPEGRMLPFAATMELFREAGIPIAPYHMLAADDAVTTPPVDGPYVVKLADVGHRTEMGAVRLNVTNDGLPTAVADLRALAIAERASPAVVVQPMVRSIGEAFIGLQPGHELGPLVAFGLGGIFLEVLDRVSGRIAPLTTEDAMELLDQFSDVKIMHGYRGQPGWDLDALAGILVAASRLAAGGREWIASLDVNPLMWTGDGYVAVDALCLVREDDR